MLKQVNSVSVMIRIMDRITERRKKSQIVAMALVNKKYLKPKPCSSDIRVLFMHQL